MDQKNYKSILKTHSELLTMDNRLGRIQKITNDVIEYNYLQNARELLDKVLYLIGYIEDRETNLALNELRKNEVKL